MKWHDMPETWYRASRVCRVLGDPKTYAIVRLLAMKGKLRPIEIAAQLNRSPATISFHLRHLRNLDIVRFQRDGRGAIYWLKEKKLVSILKELEAHVKNVRLMQ